MKKNSQIKSIKPLVLALALAGCNGGSDGSSSVGGAGQYLTPSEAEVELSEKLCWRQPRGLR
ncbi:hypothetical protein QW180_17415 [Vibrio sinaloensis]|nr:hypothetical protein [Vibrio sinaloensis]